MYSVSLINPNTKKPNKRSPKPSNPALSAQPVALPPEMAHLPAEILSHIDLHSLSPRQKKLIWAIRQVDIQLGKGFSFEQIYEDGKKAKAEKGESDLLEAITCFFNPEAMGRNFIGQVDFLINGEAKDFIEKVTLQISDWFLAPLLRFIFPSLSKATPESLEKTSQEISNVYQIINKPEIDRLKQHFNTKWQEKRKHNAQLAELKDEGYQTISPSIYKDIFQYKDEHGVKQDIKEQVKEIIASNNLEDLLNKHIKYFQDRYKEIGIEIPHDVLVDFIITEAAFIECARRDKKANYSISLYAGKFLKILKIINNKFCRKSLNPVDASMWPLSISNEELLPFPTVAPIVPGSGDSSPESIITHMSDAEPLGEREDTSSDPGSEAGDNQMENGASSGESSPQRKDSEYQLAVVGSPPGPLHGYTLRNFKDNTNFLSSKSPLTGSHFNDKTATTEVQFMNQPDKQSNKHQKPKQTIVQSDEKSGVVPPGGAFTLQLKTKEKLLSRGHSEAVVDDILSDDLVTVYDQRIAARSSQFNTQQLPPYNQSDRHQTHTHMVQAPSAVAHDPRNVGSSSSISVSQGGTLLPLSAPVASSGAASAVKGTSVMSNSSSTAVAASTTGTATVNRLEADTVSPKGGQGLSFFAAAPAVSAQLQPSSSDSVLPLSRAASGSSFFASSASTSPRNVTSDKKEPSPASTTVIAATADTVQASHAEPTPPTRTGSPARLVVGGQPGSS